MEKNYYKNGKRLLDKGSFKEAEIEFECGVAVGDIKCYYGLVAASAMSKVNMEPSILQLKNNLPDILILGIHGDADAYFILGRCYEIGLGVPQNICAATEYYIKAADMGNLDSMYNLGCLFMNTEPPNIDRALEYFEKAAQNGQVNACQALWYYYDQLGDQQKAKKWRSENLK